LHIGLDTFSPVREEDPSQHIIHREYGTVSAEVAEQLSRGKREGRRVICVGTTTVRILEHAAGVSAPCHLEPFSGWVDLFILPRRRFLMADALVTNFHLPRSTLLMLVSAYAGSELIQKAYQEAIREGYRFYSFGDAMLII
jgi:S-adenosylmethionine:tRNA ribosyltransferase-isomerase